MDGEMTHEQRVIRVVNEWIHDYREFLRDGSPHGLHKTAKEALIKAMTQAVVDAINALPPAVVRGPVNPAATVIKRQPSKPATRLGAKPSKSKPKSASNVIDEAAQP